MTNHVLNPRQYYLTLCQEVDDDLCQAMLRYMLDQGFIGEKRRVSRAQLAAALLGKADDRNDRKIRKAKEILVRDMKVPILSSAGVAGYYLAEYQDEIDAFTEENNNRIQSLHDQNTAVRKIKLPYLPPKHIQQKPLWGERL
jgi:hypothetical protein